MRGPGVEERLRLMARPDHNYVVVEVPTTLPLSSLLCNLLFQDLTTVACIQL